MAKRDISKAYDIYSVNLDADKCQRFARAVVDQNEVYFSGELWVPPMLLATESLQGILQILQDPDVLSEAGDIGRMLHAEERVVWHSVARQGDVVDIEPMLTSIEDKGSGNLLELDANVVTQSGEPLAKVTTSLFFRHPKPSKIDRGGAKVVVDMSAAENVEEWVVPADQTQTYAEASGDYNPIHLDENFAKMVGLDGRILHGMCTLSFAQRSLLKHFGNNQPGNLHELYAQFSRPVYLGDALTCKGLRVSEEKPLTHRFEVVNQHGKAVIKNGTLRMKSN
ncbi:MAG: hypothetical protein CMH60_06240 [Myxococcales bacterium]|nr:hypothetical protein [Myxococcales bacterium]